MDSTNSEIFNSSDWAYRRFTFPVDQIRNIIATDLKGAILYNIPDVLDKILKPKVNVNNNDSCPLPSEDSTFVDSLVEAIETSCAQQLKEIEELEKKGNSDEGTLYKQITPICRKIEEEAEKKYGRCAPFRRVVFKGETNMFPQFDELGTGVGRKPDYVIADVPIPEPKEALSEKHDGKISWMQCPSFIEVKAKAKDSPVRAPGKKMIEEGAKESLAQGFEYAHFILTERPCQHHVYAIFFCGNVYCVCLFDRCGVAITPLYGMKGDGLRNFVLVVLRMTREMTAVDLGFDPTVHFAPRSSEQTFYQDSHPEFIIETPNPMPGEAPQRWETFGKPIRASHSIIGRGTNVWRTYDLHTERPAILKIMWRTSRRSPEADVYASIRSHLKARGVTIPPHTSITSEISGDDVRFQGDLLSVTKQRFRGLPVDGVTGKPSNNSLKPAEVNQVEDRNLYRIAFSEFGKPLWKYKSTLEFVRVMYQVIKAHEILSKNDVLHRDISNGNILIRVHAELDGDKPSPDPRHPRNPKTGRFISKDAVTTEDTTTSHRKAAILEYDYAEEHAEGLLIDFEYASIGSETSNKAPSETSDGMSGTPLFMATQLLKAIVHKKSVVHTATFDLESFGYTIVYAIYRNTLQSGTLLDKGPVRDAIEKEFDSLFGLTSLKGLHAKRLQVFSAHSIEEEKEGNLLHGIHHLENYITNHCAILAAVLRYIWRCLKTMQPKAPQPRPPTDPISMQLEKLALQFDPPVPSIEVTHKTFLGALEIALYHLGNVGAPVEVDLKTKIKRAKENAPREIHGMDRPDKWRDDVVQ